MDASKAMALVTDWIDAWNARDLDRVLAHYTEDVDYETPAAVSITGSPRLSGKAAVRAFFEAALPRLPDLHFTPVATALGAANSVTNVYANERGQTVVEVFWLNADHRIQRASIHYAVA